MSITKITATPAQLFAGRQVIEKEEVPPQEDLDLTQGSIPFPSLTSPLAQQPGVTRGTVPLERISEESYRAENGIAITLRRTERVEGNPALLEAGLGLLRDIFTRSTATTFLWKRKEYYQPKFTLGNLAIKAWKISERLGYWGGDAGIHIAHESQQATAAIAFYKREDYARKAYEDFAKRWGLGPRREGICNFLAPLKWYHFGGHSRAIIEAQEKLWAIGLQEEVRNLCDAHGVPLDPAIERIFVPTPEEVRNISHIPPERIANFDTIHFVYKLAQKDDKGQLIPPELVPPHGTAAIAKENVRIAEEMRDPKSIQEALPHVEEIEDRDPASAHRFSSNESTQAKLEEKRMFFLTCYQRICAWVGKLLWSLWEKIKTI